MLFQLTSHVLEIIGVVWRVFFAGDVGPGFGVFQIQLYPGVHVAACGIGQNCLDRAFRLAHTTVDALVRVNDQHVFALIKAVHWTNFDAVHVLTLDALVVDDVRHA